MVFNLNIDRIYFAQEIRKENTNHKQRRIFIAIYWLEHTEMMKIIYLDRNKNILLASFNIIAITYNIKPKTNIMKEKVLEDSST